MDKLTKGAYGGINISKLLEKDRPRKSKGGTVALLRAGKSIMVIAAAYCSEKDKYVEKEGERISGLRARKAAYLLHLYHEDIYDINISMNDLIKKHKPTPLTLKVG